MEQPAEAHRYALWLLPHGARATALQHSICSLAQRWGAPVFAPHLTVCSGISTVSIHAVIAQCTALATTTHPLVLVPTALGTTSDFYRCLFLHIAANDALSVLRSRVLPWAEERQPWIPHISLLYADIPEDRKIEMMPEVSAHCNTPIECATLALYITTGTVEQWHEVASWQLAARSSID